MDFVNDIDRDEMRSGFLVTTDRKKLWNAQINLIIEFQRICKKHGLRFWAHSGTLLGAVRHRGFVPWDYDIDLAMFRDDYEKFKAVAKKEISYPYYVDIYYENEDCPPKNAYITFPNLPFMKLRDERTTMLEEEPKLYQCVSIDIFPLDSFPPFEDKSAELKFLALKDLVFATCWRDLLKFLFQNPNHQTVLDRNFLEKFMQLPLKTRGEIFDAEAYKLYSTSKYVSCFYLKNVADNILYEREWYDETVYLPFENIEIPAPKKFNGVLTAYYGDWHRLKIYYIGEPISSVDIPYKIYESEKNYHAGKNSDELRDGKIVQIGRKKIWQVQLNLIEQLKNLGCKFFAIDQTLYSAIKYRGFDPEDDFVRIGMTRSEFDRFSRLKIRFPYKMIFESAGIYFSDERTCMIGDQNDQNNQNQSGIYIEIVPVDYEPEIIYLPFEFTSIPVPENYSELLKDFKPDFKKFAGDISATISSREYLERVKS